MRHPLWLLLPFVPSFVPGPPAQEAANPLAARERFELEVQHWEGTFGTYLCPRPGDTLRLDLVRLGEPELTTAQPVEGPSGHFALDFLVLRMHTLRDDDTIREYGLAYSRAGHRRLDPDCDARGAGEGD